MKPEDTIHRTVADHLRLRERFEEKVIPEPNSGCWIWLGATRPGGYGKIRISKTRRLMQATHAALALVGRSVPDGMRACHSCDNPHCVNPDHLFVGTQRDNMADCVKKGRHRYDIGVLDRGREILAKNRAAK